MGLKSWLGLKDPTRFIRDAIASDKGFGDLYGQGIQAAQGGRSDNLHKQMRFFALAQLAKQADPKFDFAECGCMWGHSTHMLASVMEANGGGRQLHVFDSFEGLSEFGKQDIWKADLTKEEIEAKRKQFATDFATVTQTLSKFPFVHLYKGWIPERFSEVADNQFSFVSIDVDLFQPTLDSLEFFFPRLIKGGIIYFDDYGGKRFVGAKAAVDQYLDGKSVELFVRMPYASAFLKK